MDAVQHAILRGNIAAQINDCTQCGLRATAISPVPFRGKTPNRLMILGEAPGKQEDEAGRPFVGPSGKLIERLLKDAKLPDKDQWFIANTVCCRSVGPPNKVSLAACSDNLRAQVKLCQPEWVLLLGATALASTGFLKGKVSQVHGRPFQALAGPFKDVWCWPTFHPAAGLRDQRRVVDILEDMSTMSKVLRGEIDLEDVMVEVGRGGKKPIHG